MRMINNFLPSFSHREQHTKHTHTHTHARMRATHTHTFIRSWPWWHLPRLVKKVSATYTMMHMFIVHHHLHHAVYCEERQNKALVKICLGPRIRPEVQWFRQPSLVTRIKIALVTRGSAIKTDARILELMRIWYKRLVHELLYVWR